jgi:hypothetical protein
VLGQRLDKRQVDAWAEGSRIIALLLHGTMDGATLRHSQWERRHRFFRARPRCSVLAIAFGGGLPAPCFAFSSAHRFRCASPMRFRASADIVRRRRTFGAFGCLRVAARPGVA